VPAAAERKTLSHLSARVIISWNMIGHKSKMNKNYINEHSDSLLLRCVHFWHSAA
jgi:hypothetical protein